MILNRNIVSPISIFLIFISILKKLKKKMFEGPNFYCLIIPEYYTEEQ